MENVSHITDIFSLQLHAGAKEPLAAFSLLQAVPEKRLKSRAAASGRHYLA
jgi:hypothetical protein